MKLIHRKCFGALALSWTLCFILFLLLCLLVLAPQQKIKAQTEERLIETTRMHNAAIKAADQKTKLLLDEEVKGLRERLKGLVFDLEELANLTFDISQISNNVQVASFGIRPQHSNPGSATSDYDYIFEERIHVGFTASFDQFAAFLNALERHRPVVFVDKFTIIRSREYDFDHRVDMELVVLVRRQQDNTHSEAT
jgi:hypothetical protein